MPPNASSPGFWRIKQQSTLPLPPYLASSTQSTYLKYWRLLWKICLWLCTPGIQSRRQNPSVSILWRFSVISILWGYLGANVCRHPKFIHTKLQPLFVIILLWYTVHTLIILLKERYVSQMFCLMHEKGYNSTTQTITRYLPIP